MHFNTRIVFFWLPLDFKLHAGKHLNVRIILLQALWKTLSEFSEGNNLLLYYRCYKPGVTRK